MGGCGQMIINFNQTLILDSTMKTKTYLSQTVRQNIGLLMAIKIIITK